VAADPPSPSDPGPCPGCGADPGSSLACLACGRILADGDTADHFRRLGLDSLHVFEAASAEVNYLKLSRLLHPDFQAAADEETRAAALRNSALLNESWKVLNDEQLRSEYLLELHDPGVLERHKTLSPEFLMEAMEVSEKLDDARAIGCQDTLRRIASSARSEIEERMKDVATACTTTIQRIAREDRGAAEGRPAKLLSPHEWNTEQIAVLLHQARVYRRILRDTERSK
jgi:Fe-S protein assembly co-chaperone HscB